MLKHALLAAAIVLPATPAEAAGCAINLFVRLPGPHRIEHLSREITQFRRRGAGPWFDLRRRGGWTPVPPTENRDRLLDQSGGVFESPWPCGTPVQYRLTYRCWEFFTDHGGTKRHAIMTRAVYFPGTRDFTPAQTVEIPLTCKYAPD